MGEASKLCGPVAGPLAQNADDVWGAFLAERASLILQVVHLFEGDPDQVQDCFLFVCEHLHRGEMRRVRRFREAGPASFETWLRAVVRRLCLDWVRHRDGRYRVPRAIARLPELDQTVFRCVHLRGLSENETFHSVKALWPAVSRDQLAGTVARVARVLDGRSWWLLLVRRPRLQSLSSGPPGADPAEVEPGLVDPRQDPESEAAAHERLAVLRSAVGRLPPRLRLLLRLRYEQELPLEDVARLTGLSGASRVERELRKTLDDLRVAMTVRGFPGVSVKEKQRT